MHLNVTGDVAVAGAVSLLSILLVLLAAAVGGRNRRVLGARLNTVLLRGCPAWNLPDDASKALESEAALGPFATGLAGAVECAQAGVDSTLVCLGTKLVTSTSSVGGAGVIDRAVLPGYNCQHD